MYINNYFVTPVWSEMKRDFVKSLNKASDPYIKEAKKIKKLKLILKLTETLVVRGTQRN